MCTLREMVNIIVSTKQKSIIVGNVSNLIIFDVNKNHVTILSDLCRVAVVKYLHNLIQCFELSVH